MLRKLILIIFFISFSQSFSEDIPCGEISLSDNVEKIESGSSLYTDIKTYLAPGQYYLVKSINETFLYNNYNLFITIIFVFLLSIIFRSSFYNKKIFDDKHYIFVKISIVFASAILINKYVDISSSLLTSYLIVFINAIVIFRFYETKKIVYLVLAGNLLGLSGVFRHDVLSYLYGAEFWGIFFFGIKFYTKNGDKMFRKFITGMKFGIIFTAGILVIILPVFLIMLFNTDTNSLYYQLIKFPLFEYKDFYGKPFPNPFISSSIIQIFHSIWFYIPLIIFAITAFKLYFNSKSKIMTSDSIRFWKIIFLFNLGINSYNQAMIVSDIYHLLPALIVAALLIYFIVERTKFKILSVYLYIFMFLFLGLL